MPYPLTLIYYHARQQQKRHLLDENIISRNRHPSEDKRLNGIRLIETIALQPFRVRIRIAENDLRGESIKYKNDGSRFKQPCTLKLKTSSEYCIRIEVEPFQNISYMKIGSTMVEPSVRDCTSQYFVWSTHGRRRTDFRYRIMCPFVLKIEHFPEIRFNLQMKFYKTMDVLHYAGKPLTSIDLKVEPKKNSAMNVGRILYS